MLRRNTTDDARRRHGGTPAGEDFLDFNPPPPTNLATNWFHISALGTGADAIGNYIQLLVSQVIPLNGIVSDLNLDTFADASDLHLFVAGWRTDTSSMSSVDRYVHGDINLSGLTDLSDAFLIRKALIANGFANGLSLPQSVVPEPAPPALLGFAALAVCCQARRRYADCPSRKSRMQNTWIEVEWL